MSAFVEQVREDKAVKHNRNQTLGLSSCAEDDKGNECPLCAEQVDLLVSEAIAATLREAAAKVWLSDRVYTAHEAAEYLIALAEG